MGWPRSNELMRLYRDRDGSYLMVDIVDGMNHAGEYSAVANALAGPSPSPCSCQIGRAWFARVWPKRVEWSELPPEWQQAFRPWLEWDNTNPSEVRGFWRVGNMPGERIPDPSLAGSGAGVVRRG